MQNFSSKGHVGQRCLMASPLGQLIPFHKQSFSSFVLPNFSVLGTSYTPRICFRKRPLFPYSKESILPIIASNDQLTEELKNASAMGYFIRHDSAYEELRCVLQELKNLKTLILLQDHNLISPKILSILSESKPESIKEVDCFSFLNLEESDDLFILYNEVLPELFKLTVTLNSKSILKLPHFVQKVSDYQKGVYIPATNQKFKLQIRLPISFDDSDIQGIVKEISSVRCDSSIDVLVNICSLRLHFSLFEDLEHQIKKDEGVLGEDS